MCLNVWLSQTVPADLIRESLFLQTRTLLYYRFLVYAGLSFMPTSLRTRVNGPFTMP